MASIPNVENSTSTKASEMNIPNQYVNTDWGKRTKLSMKKVTTKSTDGSGKVYGSKAIMTKEDSSPTFLQFLLQEGEDDLTALPDVVISELKKKIRIGAKDLTQKWADALELVRKAYHVSNVKIPLPVRRGAWAQFEMLIKFGVSELAKARGINGDWRSATVLMKEAETPLEDQPIGKNRIFVMVPGNTSVEIHEPDATVDTIVMQLTKKLTRRGLDSVVAKRTPELVILDVYKKSSEGKLVKRESIRIQSVSSS